MTVLELCETSGRITLLNVYVRKEDGELVGIYRIGQRARQLNEDALSPVKVNVISRPIHVQDKGAKYDEFGFVSDGLPEEVMRLKVTSWRVRHDSAHIIGALEMTVNATDDKKIGENG